MKTIVIANQKGGSGKSTVTVHLAAAAEMAGDGPALITDTDRQASTADWFNQRQAAGLDAPLYAPINLRELAVRIEALEQAGAKYLFIDTAPSIDALNAELLAAADLVLIPLNPNPADLRALVKGLPLVRGVGRPFCFVLTGVRPNLRNNEAVAIALQSLGVVLPTRLHERVIYAETFGHGRTAFEIDPTGVAACELNRVWEAVKRRLQESEIERNGEKEKVRISA